MSWKKALPELSPVLSSPKPYQVEPTLTMPRPCIWSVVPEVSVQAWPGVNCDVAAWAGAWARPTRARADRAVAAAQMTALTVRRLDRVNMWFPVLLGDEDRRPHAVRTISATL